MSFRYKTILGVAFIEAIMLSLLVWNALSILTSSNEMELIKRAKTTTELFATSNKDAVLSSDLATLESFVAEVLTNPGIIYARVLDMDGLVLAQGGDEKALARPFEPDRHYLDVKDGGFDAFAVIEEAGVIYGRVEIGFSIKEIDAVIAGARRKSVTFASVEMFLTAIFSLILGIYLTRTINHLRVGAQKISAGQLGYQIEVKGRDELAAAAAAFNDMSFKLGQLETARKRHEEELQQLIENVPGAGMITTPDWKPYFVSNNSEKLLGVKKSSLLDGSISYWHLIDSQDREGVVKELQQLGLEMDFKVLEYRIRNHRTGVISWVRDSKSAQRDIDGKLNGFISVIIDITDEKQAIEKGIDADTLNKAIVDTAVEGILTIDHDDIIETHNPAAREIFGYKASELNGIDIHQLIPAVFLKGGKINKEASTVVTDVVTDRKNSKCLETTGVRKNKLAFPVEVAFQKVVLHGKVIHTVVVRDITERKRAEDMLLRLNEELEQRVEERTKELKDAQDELVRKEKLAVLGQLAGSVGHEIRNPLGVIGNSVYFLKIKLKGQDEKVLKHLNILQSEVQRSSKLINDLLGFSKASPPSLEEGDLNSIVKETLAGIEILENITLETRLDINLTEILLDPEQIHQVFQNLISNALQTMPEGGRLTIKTRANGDFVDIMFSDTGEGIPEENLPKIFEPLFTVKAKGIGLGLAIVKGIIDCHKGRIEVESAVGKGTTFTVKLPRGLTSDE